MIRVRRKIFCNQLLTAKEIIEGFVAHSCLDCFVDYVRVWVLLVAKKMIEVKFQHLNIVISRELTMEHCCSRLTQIDNQTSPLYKHEFDKYFP